MGVPLDPYASACTRLDLELRESLTEEEIDELREDCRALGWKGWASWFRAHYEMILLFLESTPSVRSKKKIWQDPVQRRRLVLASIQHLRGATVLLDVAARLEMQTGESYRKMGRIAAEFFWEVLSEPVEHWPLDDPNPFD